MTLVTVSETGKANDSPNAAVIFERQGDGYPITVKGPFSSALAPDPAGSAALKTREAPPAFGASPHFSLFGAFPMI